MTDKARLSPLARTRPIIVTPGLVRRFWSKVDTSGGPDACWMWTGKVQNGGYGVLVLDGSKTTTLYAHRLSWAIATGADPGALCVCHRCDKPGCLNHTHHFLGTATENTADMVQKGRHRSSPPWQCGERVGGSKLTEAKVRELRQRSATGEGSGALGKLFGVDSSTVRQIVRREIWRHVA